MKKLLLTFWDKFNNMQLNPLIIVRRNSFSNWLDPSMLSNLKSIRLASVQNFNESDISVQYSDVKLNIKSQLLVLFIFLAKKNSNKISRYFECIKEKPL